MTLMTEPDVRLMLTPFGALQAFAELHPAPHWAQLQTLMGADIAPHAAAWVQAGSGRGELLAQATREGWVHTVMRELRAPDVRLDNFLPHVIAGLSGQRTAALASEGGFCIGRVGYTQEQADILCAAAADFSEFAARQRHRGWPGAGRFVAFHQDAAMLLPSTSFVPFWVDGVAYSLILEGEPLLNNTALVELIWGVRTSGARFSPA